MTGPGLHEIAAGGWHRLTSLGWPLTLLGEEAEVFVVPIPNPVRNHGKYDAYYGTAGD